MEIHGEEIKRMSKEALDRWNKEGLTEIRDTKLEEKSTVVVAVKLLEEL